MKRILCATGVLAVFGLLSAVSANQDLLKLQTDDNQWTMPGKNYSATRFSTLKQNHDGQHQEPQAGHAGPSGSRRR